MSLIGFKAKNHPQQAVDDDTDDRRTLPEVFDPLNLEHGFTLDVAASDENAKCAKYFTKIIDGLTQSWAGETIWCNPPYSGIGPWVEKAIAETQRGSCPKVIMLLPANRCEQKWWQEFIEPVRDRAGSLITVSFMRGRPRFGWNERRPRPKKGDRPPFGLVVIIFKGKAV